MSGSLSPMIILVLWVLFSSAPSLRSATSTGVLLVVKNYTSLHNGLASSCYSTTRVVVLVSRILWEG